MSTSIAQFRAPASAATRRLRMVDGALTIGMLLTMAAVAAPQFAPAAEENPRTVVLATQIESLQSVIERFRGASPDSCYPDLVQHGWAPLLEHGLVREAPINRLNGRSDVASEPMAGAGWHYDPVTGRIGARYFDEATRRVTPESP